MCERFCERFFPVIVIIAIVSLEGCLIWWLVDAIIKFNHFCDISPWLGPWNLYMAIFYLLIPWTILFPFLDEFCEWGSSSNRLCRPTGILIILSYILIGGALFSVVVFYLVVVAHWESYELKYKVAWTITTALIQLAAVGSLVYGLCS